MGSGRRALRRRRGVTEEGSPTAWSRSSRRTRRVPPRTRTRTRLSNENLDCLAEIVAGVVGQGSLPASWLVMIVVYDAAC